MLPKFETDAVCRICLQDDEDGEMLSIYDFDENETIVNKVQSCTGIKLLQEPNLPNKICNNCYIFLNFAYKFREICRNSQFYLRDFASSSSSLSSNQRSNRRVKQRKDAEDSLNAAEDGLLVDEAAENDSFVKENIIDTDNEFLDESEDVNYGDVWFEDATDEHFNEVYITKVEDEAAEASSKVIKRIVKTSKKPVKRIRTADTTTSKTLDISPDGTAIIREHKANSKKTKLAEKHICEVCGNTYPKKYTLEAHMRRHRDEKPYECEICGQAFHFNFQLTRHIRKHTGVRPYACQYCLRTFKDRSTLVKHERIHRNERPFKCDTCQKTFTYSNVLKAHMLTHTGEKPYTCGICGKRFTRAHHLRAHLETLYHSRDPRAQILIKQIKPEESTTQETIVTVVQH